MNSLDWLWETLNGFPKISFNYGWTPAFAKLRRGKLINTDLPSKVEKGGVDAMNRMDGGGRNGSQRGVVAVLNNIRIGIRYAN